MDIQKKFFSFLPPLPLPHEMRQWDEGAVALGLPELLLMENAAQAALSVMHKHFVPLQGKRIWLFMGSGNNGGDAACLARHLLDAGAYPLLWHSKALSAYKGVTSRHLRLARSAGVTCRHLSLLHWPPMPDDLPHFIVDGLLGTGFKGPLRPNMRVIIQRINVLGEYIPVLALDIPSGLDGLTGLPTPEAVQARHTVSFAAAKVGLLQPAARPWTGQVHVRPIGIPARVRHATPCSAFLLDGHCLQALPPLIVAGHKNSYGHVLILGGAPGMGGAAHLAARAALRCGAGLVTAAAPVPALADIKCNTPEIMVLGLPVKNGHTWPDTLPPTLQEILTRCTALVIGPGMGRTEGENLLTDLLFLPERPPVVLDADALMQAARRRTLLASLRADDIITPHPGEAAALLASSTAAVQGDRLAALKDLCSLSKAAVILKGAGCLVGQHGSPWLLSPYDLPTLSVGGSGDVLAGCAGALIARMSSNGMPALPAAALAVALHDMAGLECARRNIRGHLASELADALPLVWSRHTAPTVTSLPFQEALPWPPSI